MIHACQRQFRNCTAGFNTLSHNAYVRNTEDIRISLIMRIFLRLNKTIRKKVRPFIDIGCTNIWTERFSNVDEVSTDQNHGTVSI